MEEVGVNMKEECAFEDGILILKMGRDEPLPSPRVETVGLDRAKHLCIS